MRAKKMIISRIYTYLELQMKGLQRGTLCGPVFCIFCNFFNRIVIKKTAVLNQVIFWILERFLFYIYAFKYN